MQDTIADRKTNKHANHKKKRDWEKDHGFPACVCGMQNCVCEERERRVLLFLLSHYKGVIFLDIIWVPLCDFVTNKLFA